jgi:uncharacterized protein (DUF2384 family)
MAKELKGYDGAVNGVKIVHGVAFVTQTIPDLHGRRVSIPALPSLSQDAPSRSDIDIKSVVERAIEVIGDPADAMRWLGTPLRALDFATPISRLHNPAGHEQILAILTQLEHGVL